MGTKLSWGLQNSGTGQNLRGVTYGKGLFVAVGDKGTILTSKDGQVWTQQSSGVVADLWGVTYSEAFGGFVAVGAWGTVLHSPDGISWSKKPTNQADWLYGVTGGTFVITVGARGLIISSLPAFAWTQDRPCDERLYGVVSHNLGAVAVGEKGTILSSSDTRNWQIIPTYLQTHLWDVAKRLSDEVFVAVGESGTILFSHSQNPTVWETISSGAGPNLYGVTVAFDHITSYGSIQGTGIFVAVGGEGTILLSGDGKNWEEAPAVSEKTLWDVVGGKINNKDLVVAVGENGTIVTTQ